MCKARAAVSEESRLKMDFEFAISGGQWIGIAVGAILYMVLSMIWYMPRIFGEMWMQDEGLTQQDLSENEAAPIYVLTLVLALISNISIALVLSNVGGGWLNGLLTGLLIGVGVTAMSIAPHYLFAGKRRLAVLQGAHAAVLITVSGVIIGTLT